MARCVGQMGMGLGGVVRWKGGSEVWVKGEGSYCK